MICSIRFSLKFVLKIIVPVLILFVAATVSAQTLSGVVVDRNGAGIENASVVLLEGNFQRSKTKTDDQGRFAFSAIIGSRSRLAIAAEGFAPFERALKNDGVWDFTIILQPAVVAADVTVSVTRTETRLSETPASVVVLSRETLDSTAAQSIDDSLRQIAGFTLFRRSSSKTANPTTQGANLRGVSGSGASRAAVLFDGLSLNDAFGGWTYWSRVPQIAVEQAEMLRGGASSLYGTGGLSGAVNLVPIKTESDWTILNIRSSAGAQDTSDGSLFAAAERNGWAIDLAAETFQTGGYIPTAENERGLADARANSRHNNFIFTVERRFGIVQKNSPADAGGNDSTTGRIFARGNVFSERRDNGTRLTNNRTYFRQMAGGFDLSSGSFGTFQARAFIEAQVYDQTFSAVSADRNTETLVRLQRVPSQAFGSSLFWTRGIKAHTLTASFETREVRGFSDEIGYFGGRPTSASDSGGSERTYAFLIQDNWQPAKKLNLSFGVRVDSWKNFDAHSTIRTLATNAAAVARFADRNETAVSPRVAAIYQITDSLSAYGAYSRSFRAPTRNELYRGFRVGNVVTQANENLRAEQANTFEGGLSFTGLKRRLNVRGNVFVTEVTDPVVSVTLATTPTLITRQRQNAGETRTRGLEVDAEFAPRSDLKLSVSYLLADSRVTRFPSNPSLVGNFLPQIARQLLNFQFNYRPRSRFFIGIQSRISGGQFEDDVNSLRLNPYLTTDATAAYRAHRKIEIFVAAENIFNAGYDIALTPNRTVAAPAFVRVGMRLNLGQR